MVALAAASLSEKAGHEGVRHFPVITPATSLLETRRYRTISANCRVRDHSHYYLETITLNLLSHFTVTSEQKP
jgi:uncharacterized membrane protein